MNWTEKQVLRVAILDLNEGKENQGMRCLREILHQFADYNHLELIKEEFEVRINKEIPSLDFDVYLSSGGPGSPLESEGTEWENKYFNWLNSIVTFNKNPSNLVKKQVFLICHSFQLATRHFGVARVSKRKSTAFGVFPIHYLSAAFNEPIFKGLNDPFYAVDSRDYQVTQPNHNRIEELGGSILAIEKARPHVPLERAIMALRFTEYMIGTQFHPEADATGMSLHLQKPDKKEMVIENYGQAKWESMLDRLNDPEMIMHTYAHILPNFLTNAVKNLQITPVVN